MNKKLISIYTLLHFAVDFTTIFLVTSVITLHMTGVDMGNAIIVYNLLAFAGQLPLGMVTDALNKNTLFAVSGCLLTSLAYPSLFVSPWLACILAALGNGAFHIGAGADVLKMTMPKAWASGIFVSSGALGVWLAYAVDFAYLMWVCPLVMVTGAVLLLFQNKCDLPVKNQVSVYTIPKLGVLVAVILLMITIIIRSLLGSMMNFSWKSIGGLSFASVLAVVCGKALGGMAADRIGVVKTALISLLLSSVLFVFSVGSPLAGITAIMLFNMTMPLTLTMTAKLCKGKYGFAFGLTTFALAVGFIPTVFGVGRTVDISVFAGGCIVSLVLIVLGCYLHVVSQR